MPNRLTRDQIITNALDQSQAQNLINHDIPNGIVQPNAFSIQWIQDILDYWYNVFPFSSTVVPEFSLPIPANTTDVTLPTDFILDVRNGYIYQPTDQVSSQRRMIRVPLQRWINRDVQHKALNIGSSSASVTTAYTLFYTILGDPKVIKVTPQVATNTPGFLWYYKLPDILESNTIPALPNDYALVEYLRLRSLEWIGVLPAGTAMAFSNKIVAVYKSSGLLNETEDDEIPFDSINYRRGTDFYNTYQWMGPR